MSGRAFRRAANPLALLIILLLGVSMSTASAQSFPRFDFTRAEDGRGWEPTHNVSRLRGTPEGLEITISGGDPYIHGPARSYPAGTLLWLSVRLKSEQSGTAQIFYFRAGTGATEAQSVRFPVPADTWEEVRLPLPALGPGFRLRFDPPGTGGKCLLAWLRSEARVLLREPAWPQPVHPEQTDDALSLRSGELHLAHDGKTPGSFVLHVGDRKMADGLTPSVIGYLHGDQPRWAPGGVAAWEGLRGVGEALGAVHANRAVEYTGGRGDLLMSVTVRQKASDATQPEEEIRPRRWTREEYYRAADLGLFRPEERLELLDGEILQKMAPRPSHSVAVGTAGDVLTQAFATGTHVRTEQPLVLHDESEPAPDIVVVPGKRSDYLHDHPTAKDALLVVEISDSSIRFDRGRKREAYARAGIRDYWVLNLPKRQLEVHREPTGSRYRSVTVYRQGDTVSPLAAPHTAVAVDDLLLPDQGAAVGDA